MEMTENPAATRPSVDELTAQVHKPNECSKVYWDNWNAFKQWVDKTDGQSKSEDGNYLVRDNVDRFFLLAVVKKNIVPKSARRFACALQFFANNYEHHPPLEAFKVRSPAVTTALDVQRVNYIQKKLAIYASAHDRLPTNNLTPSEETAIIKYGMQIMAWKDFLSHSTHALKQ